MKKKKKQNFSYSRFQKFLSGLLIFTLLSSMTVRIPFLDFKNLTVEAWNSNYYDLVSIIVDKDSYSEIDTYIDRYAKDIQWVLENTKVVILPISKNQKAFNIASLNEGLYFDWYKALDSGVDFESKLVWTILVWDFELPIVYDNNDSSKTILPFTDFEDKKYIYNKKTLRYEKNDSNITGLKSEIWHWVISPNLWSHEQNITGLKDYFDKNHDYYSGTGNFKFSKWILNQNNNIPVNDSYEPFVFYYDQFREEKALNYTSYMWYKAYLENKEDLIYSRFTKDLANKLTDDSLSSANSTMMELLEQVNPELASQAWDLQTTADLSKVPDIQTRHIIQKTVKKFIESFSKGTLWDFRKDVNNAWRYSWTGSQVNMDMIPYLVTVLDLVNDEIVKDINTELESQIDDLIQNWLSKDIAIPTTFNTRAWGLSWSTTCSNTTTQNYLYGKKASNISNAKECSIYRWSLTNSWTLVEANRAYNIHLAVDDNNTLMSEPSSDHTHCFSNLLSWKSTYGWWGWNSPLNIDDNATANWEFVLDTHDLHWSITPLFDISGSKAISDTSNTPSPLDCLDHNMITAEKHWLIMDSSDEWSTCWVIYRIPTFWERVGWTCTTDNNWSSRAWWTNYETKYKTLSSSAPCEIKTLNLWWSAVKTTDTTSSCMEDENPTVYTFNYKKITSDIKHISPNPEELKEEVWSMIPESLPIDKDRYVDFLSPLWNHIKIDYPALFRLEITDQKEVTLDKTSEEIEKILKEKSEEINQIIRDNDPSSLSGDNLTIYNHLKTWDYPTDDFDLTTILKNKEDKIITVEGDTKSLSYYDILVFSVYWNNLNSVSAKYGFIFDHYLTDQFWEPDKKYYLPRNKKQYEVAYLWAVWDAANMYVKLDPESKADNPYADILSDNTKLSSNMLWSNIWRKDESPFKCAPPDWVPIWEWIPAIMCRIGNMLPPTISLSDGVCWPSLLSSEEREELMECSGDVDKNGINDCLEQKLWTWAILELNSDSEKYYYNKTASLNSIIKDKDWNVVKVANATDIYFELIKIEEADDKAKLFDDTNTKTVFDIDSTYLNDKWVISDYVTFKDLAVRSSGGKASYSISTKSKDANIYLQAHIKINDAFWNETIFIESEPLKIEIRWDRLFNTSYKLENTNDNLEIFQWVNSLKVNNLSNIFLSDGTNNTITDIKNSVNNFNTSKEKTLLFIENLSKDWTKLQINYPLTVNLLDADKQVLETLSLSSEDLSLFRDVFTIQKSGTYTIEVIDDTWFKTLKTLELLPEDPDRLDIELSSNILESWWNVSTNFVTIYDKFDNPVSWEYYNLDFDISWDSVVFLDNDLTTLKTNTFLWYKVFRLKSTQNSWTNSLSVVLKDTNDNTLTTSEASIEVLDSIDLETTLLSDKVVVWGGTYKYELLLKDSSGNLLSNFDSRVYFTADSNFIESINPYVNIVWGKAEIEFKTKTVATTDLNVSFQVEWLSTIKTESLTIYPEKPIKIDLILSKSKIEASEDASSTLNVELKDRYNNIVFDDNTTITDLEILDKYSHIITSDKTTDQVNKWKASYKIYGTINPWVAYFKVGTNPSLSLNSFTITDENNTLVVKWVGENVWKIETFYFWNKDKLSWKRYNSIYTTLLWANYWDITQKDYLAWSLLFEKENRALAVSSLLNNPFNFNNILSLNTSGGIKSIYNSSDLTQDIELTPVFEDDKLVLNMFNASLNIFIWKALYNFDSSSLKLVSCDNTSSCVDTTNSSIFLNPLSASYTSILENDKLILRDNTWKDFLEINNDGTINRLVALEFEVNDKNTSNYLSLSVKSWVDIIAEIWLNFIDWKIDVSRDASVFDAKKTSVKNAILLNIESNSYWTNISEDILKIHYLDPFDSDTTLNNFTRGSLDWFENFPKEAWIGWKEGNKSLLAFASWKSVGESIRDYMSFWTIVLWDPVVSLKKIKNKIPWTNIDRSFDSSIWKIVDTDDDTREFRVFDYDNDSKEDILLIKSNNNFKLLENKDIAEQNLSKWNLANVVDLWNPELIQTWDFSWDWYDDIFFINNKWLPFLLNNYKKDFYRLPLETSFNLAWRVVRTASFDMDNDGVSDIVTLDESWEINIFYGISWSPRQPNFTKLKVSEWHWIKLKTWVRKDNWLVYFSWLYQPPETTYTNKQIDDLLFVAYPYSTWSLVENTSWSTLVYTWSGSVDEYFENLITWEEGMENEIPNIYFLKSDYSDYSWLDVEKRFEDLNGGLIKTDDIIGVEITLTNTSPSRLKNVVYVEKTPSAFIINKNSIEADLDTIILDWQVGYDFLVEWLELAYGESTTIYYEVKTRALKHSLLEVWLFEKGEVWDDEYWDIIIKPDNKNCSNPVNIFRSIAARDYNEGTKKPVCDENKIKLPDELEQNTFDSDGNGIPDYIDELSNTWSTDNLKEYSEEKLEEINTDSDNDGLPDMNDSFNMDGSITVDLWSWMWWIDSALDWIDNLLTTLSCWFGSASCFAMPLNRAPLAPWNDPVIFWKTIWDWAKIDEWLPIFSGLTWKQTTCWKVPCCLPSVWPMESAGFIPGPFCWPDSAWGRLGTRNPFNAVRFFVTPTLTWGVWTAICFWPAALAGDMPPKPFSPFLPWGNCIVVAAKLFGCSDDWSDWDPASMWVPFYAENFWIINWNCSDENTKQKQTPTRESVSSYLEDTKRWPVEEAFDFLPWVFSEEPSWSLFTESSWWGDVMVEVDLSSFDGSNFEDIIKINQTRIKPFPAWLMDWVTRQIEEIVNKLTDFPTIYVILPDFGWILEWDFSALKYNNEVWDEPISIDTDLIENNEYLDEETRKDWWEKAKKVNSWIKKAYEFIGNTPLVKLEQETVDMTLPWISQTELNKTIKSRKATLKQWEDEVQRAKRNWTSTGWLSANADAFIEYDNLIWSLRNNLEVIQEYKRLPEKINWLIEGKQKYLEQILCNIETLSNILWGRIWKNGERFKTWVELYILIKAILKSWQLIVDIFVDFEAECSECKNERYDSLDGEFWLLDFLAPSIPVIQFPKWPDIIIDLHNIRAWMTVQLPEYDITTKPLLLPMLPELHLPDRPTVELSLWLWVDLPTLPVLPMIEIPELPDLPSIPTINLPDLPPPPKLPKLLSAIEMILQIVDLIMKAVCLLKKLPIHPEHRAWLQIAFLTERNWYLGMDFFNMSMPEFSFPFIDAIKITSYVNLEFEVDFLVEMARQIAAPINAFSNDFTEVFRIDADALDFRDMVPSHIDINATKNWIELENSFEYKSILKQLFVKRVESDVKRLTAYMEDNKEEKVTAREFKKLMLEWLSSEKITANPKTEKLRRLWETEVNRTFSKEDKLIKELQDNNREKFDALKNIINTELIKGKALKKKIKDIEKTPVITEVSYSSDSNFEMYEKTMDKYNQKFIEKAKALITPWDDGLTDELKQAWENLKNSIKTPLQRYVNNSSDNLLANISAVNSNTVEKNACEAQANSDYRYKYQWIYVVEEDKSYRLFNYLDELSWDEKTTVVDIDSDGDEDLLYFMWNRLYLKENLKESKTKSYVTENPIVVNEDDNKFFNGDIFYESVNNALEVWNATSSINLSFSASSDNTINKYRVSFYNIVDKFINKNTTSYVPEFTKKSIVDAVSDIDTTTIFETNSAYTKRKNLVTVKNVWTISDVKLKNTELIDIKDDIGANNIVTITKWTRLYSWADPFTIVYTVNDWEEAYTMTLNDSENIEFNLDINISWITWSAYIEWVQDEYIGWMDIYNYRGKPLLPWAKIVYEWSNYELSTSSYIDLLYHDNSEANLHFEDAKSWELYNLWYASSDYFIKQSKNNDYYYAKINAFKDNIFSSSTRQILLAPQKESDLSAPELSFNTFRLPIYQKKIFDLTNFIYENSGIRNIDTVKVDLDLLVDSDGDWNTKNDENTTRVIVDKSLISLKVELWEFSEAFTKKIWITITDTNWNIWYSEVDLEVYPPSPIISSYSAWDISWYIDEALQDEPINFYRYRWWEIISLEDKDWDLKAYTADWLFSFSVEPWDTKWLTLSKDSSNLLTVNEDTWKIDLLDSSLTTRVLPYTHSGNDSSFTKIIVSDASQDIYYQYLRAKSISEVKIVDDFDNITENWIYVSFTNKSNYNYYSTPSTATYNPWALSIYRISDLNKSELFTIFKDARIDTINQTNYSLEYDTHWDYIVIKLIDWHFNREVAKVLFRLEWEYIMK